MALDRTSKDHINIRILQHIMSGIPLILGLGTRVPDPYAYIVLYHTILFHTIPYHILYYTILYYTILYYTILYYTILYYTILYYTILYYTILYYTILYYTTLYYTILYHIILKPTITLYTIPSPLLPGLLGPKKEPGPPAGVHRPARPQPRGRRRAALAVLWHQVPGKNQEGLPGEP